MTTVATKREPMTQAEILRLGNDLLHRYVGGGWRIRLSTRMTKTYGSCTYSAREIRISWPLASRNAASQTEDTVRHEVAHAIAGPGAGHGPTWKAACRVVGARPKACYDAQAVVPAAKWLGICEACGGRGGARQQLPKAGRAFAHKASKCARGNLPQSQRKLVWKKNT